MTTITQGATCFFLSNDHSWVLGTVETLEPKDLFTCKTRTSGGVISNGVQAETLSKLKKDDIFLITNAALLEEDPDDLLLLTLLHDSTLMHALNQRYFKDIIYTYIGPIVVAFNPFKYTIPWYKDDQMVNYLAEDHVIKKNKPHSWSVAHNTYWEMLDRAENQCILVSGESGAGKTEAVKIVMKYLGAISSQKGTEQQRNSAKEVGHKLLQASPILEGFGNAKTVRNDNSSRFGKFMKVQFDKEGFLVGAFTIKYLLEKSRIVTAGKGERIYHAFYLLTAGADGKKYGCDMPQTGYKSLNAGGTTNVPGVDDAGDYNACCAAMEVCGISSTEREEIWKVVGGILNLVNVEFKPSGEKSAIDGTGKGFVGKASTLWQIKGDILEKELLTTTGKAGASVFTKELTPVQAADVRDSLVKALYDELFGWLVDRINKSASVDVPGQFIGLLDIFGFEDFEVNSFEQLCINLANETLQGHYNNYIFNKDMEECRSEGVDVTQVEFPDNTPCLTLITAKMGVLAMLDEECALGKGSDDGFLTKLSDQHGKHPFFEKKRLVKTAFVIKHYAGDVSYEVVNFLDKNRDTLKDDMKLLLRSSTSPFIAALLPEPVDKAGKKLTVGGFFKNQLADLMALINSTNPHWIRCIKPHPAKKPNMWHGVQVHNQLSSSGVIGTVKVRKAGFPIRLYFSDFLKRFRILKPGPLSDPKGTCQGIVTHMGFERRVCQVGTTRVFMKSEPYAKLEDAITTIAGKYILVIQAWVRMYLAGVIEKDKDFDLNKGTIIERVRKTLEIVAAESNARKSILKEEEMDWGDITLPCFELMEENERKRIIADQEESFSRMTAEEVERQKRLEEERQAALRDRLERERIKREKLTEAEIQDRATIVAQEDEEWKVIEVAAVEEARARRQLREQERKLRKAIEEEEDELWTSFIKDEQESHQYWKNQEQTRLAEEWKALIEGVYMVREHRKLESVNSQKEKLDSKRSEMTERRREQYHADQLPRNNPLAERQAFDPRLKAARDSTTAQQELDADQVVQKYRERKELLVSRNVSGGASTPPTIFPPDARKTEVTTPQSGYPPRRLYGPGGNAVHDALSARVYPHDVRSPLSTHAQPPNPSLFSQRVHTTSEEIIAARSPKSPLRSPSPSSSAGSPAFSPGGGRYSPHVGEFGSIQEPMFSPIRTRAAAGLDASGHPISPMMPQPIPVTQPSRNPQSPKQQRRAYILSEYGI